MRNQDKILLEQAYSSVYESIHASSFTVNPETTHNFDEFQDVENEFIVPADYVGDFDHEQVASLITKLAQPLFSVVIEDLDPSVDGETFFYKVEDVGVLQQIANVLAQDDSNLELSNYVQKGIYSEFALHHHLSGFSGEDFGSVEVMFVEEDGTQQILQWLRTNT